MKKTALFSSVDSPSQGKGSPVSRGKAPFLCSFLDIEISKFRKELLLLFCRKLNLISGENSPLNMLRQK